MAARFSAESRQSNTRSVQNGGLDGGNNEWNWVLLEWVNYRLLDNLSIAFNTARDIMVFVDVFSQLFGG